MGENKRIAKNTIYLYLRMVVTLCISLYTSRAFLNILGVEDYGIYNVVGGFVSMLSIVSGSLTNASSRFLTFEMGRGNMECLKQTFSTILIVLIVISFIVIIIGETVGIWFLREYIVIPEHRYNAALFVFHCSLISFIVNIISIPYISLVTAHEKMDFYAVMSILESVLKLSIVFLLYKSPFDKLYYYAFLYVLVGIIIRIIYHIYCHIHFDESKFKFVFNKDIYKNIYSYSLWVTIGGSSAILKEQGVNVLINIFFGVILNAARGIAMQVYGVITQFSSNIGTAITPQITKSYAAGNVERSIFLTFILARAQGYMLILISIPIWIEADYILKIWLGEVPYYTVIFTRWVIVLAWVRTLENTHGPLYLATGNVKKLQLIGGGLMLLNLPVSYLLLKIGYAPESTMIVGCVMEIIVMLVVFHYLEKITGFPLKNFILEVLVPMLLVIFLSASFSYGIHCCIDEGFLRFILICFLSVMSSSVCIFYIGMKRDERKMVCAFLRQRLQKNKI